MIRGAALLTLALAFPAGAFELAFPVDCTLGATCHIQQYADHDPGPGARDFTCGPLSYDGHDGTDIALATRAEMAAGVSVLAAAPGRVKGMRDGIADFAPVIADKECGNGLVIDHGDGWETQYCHMKQGSVAVQTGDLVETGTPLGQVGQSGMAEFPHMHLSVRHNGEKLDPFSLTPTTCGAAADDLWTVDPLIEPGGLLKTGITDRVPDYDAIKAGLPSPDLPGDAPALVLWTYLFGSQPGDAIVFTLNGPEGDILTERVVLEKAQAQAFRAVGRKLKTAAWPQGKYSGTAVLIRDRVELERQTVILTVGP